MPLFITFEGIDGCGKTTQLKLLHDWLLARDHDVIATREPGGTALAEAIRDHLLHCGAPVCPQAELMLFVAARAQHVAEVIAPALARGAVVLSDRFTDSTLAYQGGGLGLDETFIRSANKFATGEVVPDVTFLFDLDVAAARARRLAAGSADDTIEQRGLDFQNRVRQGFLRLAQEQPERIVVMDATLPTATTHANILQHLSTINTWP